jgi:hypothetical protein
MIAILLAFDVSQYEDWPQAGGHLATWQAMLFGAYLAFVLYVFVQSWRNR